jgi:Holin of 3TMs, for gene-transfer release
MNNESWMNRKWRPAMGWTYMAICILDFAIFPIAWSVLQAYADGTVTSQWDPLTLKGAGLFHMAMGAVLGIAAWSRGQEKMAGVVASPPLNNKPTLKTEPEDPPFRNTRND